MAREGEGSMSDEELKIATGHGQEFSERVFNIGNIDPETKQKAALLWEKFHKERGMPNDWFEQATKRAQEYLASKNAYTVEDEPNAGDTTVNVEKAVSKMDDQFAMELALLLTGQETSRTDVDEVEKIGDPETNAELDIISEANTLVAEGITKNDPEKIVAALKAIDDGPDTTTVVRQRDDSKVAAAKRALSNLLSEITNVDTWLPPEAQTAFKDLGSDVVKAIGILWNENDKTLFQDLARVTKHFYKKHGVGAAISMATGEGRPQIEL